MAEALNKELFNKAKRYIPGGVNSPVRSFQAVGGYPIFIKEAKGSKIYGECGREFIDYCLGFGALILGHAHPKVRAELKKAVERGSCFGAPTKEETDLARLIIEAVPSIEKIRLTNSGTEAVMSAIRLSRAFTGKNKIMKFQGGYHGHADYLLDCPGVPEDFKKHTLTVPYNDIEKVKVLVESNKEDLAAIIVEPVAGNMGVVLPQEGFLAGLREITKRHNMVLIFDEVITGFRFTFGGVQKLFGITPDLTCLGKIIGGGLPVGAFGGRKEIMQLLVPEGNVYQAGTFSGNPLTVSAGLSALRALSNTNPYQKLGDLTRQLCGKIIELSEGYAMGLKIIYTASMFSVSLEKDLFKRFYHGLLKAGVYFAPSSGEANFLSTAHTAEDINKTLEAVTQSLKNLKEK